MDNDFLISNHPWHQLKERVSAPFSPSTAELEIMKFIIEGKSIQDIAKQLNTTIVDVKTKLSDGMKKVDVKNLYELVVWGLRRGLVKDEPLTDVNNKLSRNVTYIEWAQFLNQLVTGGEINLPKSTQESYKQSMSKMFNIGPSNAEFLRFAFQVVHPITPQKSFRGYKTHVPHFVKTGVSSKFAMIPSKFKPADIDPNLHPVYQSLRMGKKVGTKSGSIQTALKILGINPDVVKAPINKKSFWEHKPERLWQFLELARSRFDYEIAHAHPDRGGDVNRAKQVISAWKFVKDMFKKRGYEFHE